jgi:hypothetical protein
MSFSPDTIMQDVMLIRLVSVVALGGFSVGVTLLAYVFRALLMRSVLGGQPHQGVRVPVRDLDLVRR